MSSELCEKLRGVEAAYSERLINTPMRDKCKTDIMAAYIAPQSAREEPVVTHAATAPAGSRR